MKKGIVLLSAALVSLASFGAGEGASQKWVKWYVEQYVANAVSNAIENSVATLVTNARTTESNGVRTVSVGEGRSRMWFSYEDATINALVATNATEAAAAFGITNGFLFVWNGDGTYVNGNGETIVTYTNRNCLTWHEVDSAVTDGFETFAGNFAVLRTMLQPSVAHAVTNSLRTASMRSSEWRPTFFDLIGSLFVSSALAAAPGKLPQSAEEWYTPVGESLIKEKEGEIHYRNQDTGEWTSEKMKLNNIESINPDQYDGLDKTAFSALKIALAADKEAQEASEGVIAIADHLAALDWTTLDTEVKDSSSGATASGTTTKEPGKIVIEARGILGGKGADVDGQTIVTNRMGRLALKNLPDVSASYSYKNGFYIPYFSSSLNLKWILSGLLVDSKSLGWSAYELDGGSYLGWGVKGWHDDKSCKEKLSDMMADPSHEEQRGKHEILCRYGGKGGDLHYLPLGGVLPPQTAADGATVSTNETGMSGKFAIRGAYESGNADKALFSTGAGIEWRVAAGGAALRLVGTDEIGVTVGSGATTNTVTFASASDSNVKVKVTGGGASAKVEIGVYWR